LTAEKHFSGMDEIKKKAGDCGDIPPCGIRIDKDGVWYFRGAEMFRKEIVGIFYQNLRRDDSGRYLIEMGTERCVLEVEDTPFVVKSVFTDGSREGGDKTILLAICDETIEELNPATLRVGRGNVLYCHIKNGEHEARFSRSSYYQIANYFDYDSENNQYVLILNDKRYVIIESPENQKMMEVNDVGR
jgi:hypothetical protein